METVVTLTPSRCSGARISGLSSYARLRCAVAAYDMPRKGFTLTRTHGDPYETQYVAASQSAVFRPWLCKIARYSSSGRPECARLWRGDLWPLLVSLFPALDIFTPETGIADDCRTLKGCGAPQNCTKNVHAPRLATKS
jgi:hypothetical protein